MQFDGPFDHLSDEEIERAIFSWIMERPTPVLDLSSADEYFNFSSPRALFLKDLPENSKVLDLGAGDGGLSVLRDWPLYQRSDLRLYALSLDKGDRFDSYESYELKNFEDEGEIFAGIQFDAIVCCHFIEHLPAPRKAIEFMAKRLRPGGKLYLEWPHPFSNRMPSRQKFLDAGLEISTTRFDEDPTHHSAWEMDEIVAHAVVEGFAVEAGGRVILDWKTDQMMVHALAERDPVRLTLALWSKVGWAQYLCARRK